MLHAVWISQFCKIGNFALLCSKNLIGKPQANLQDSLYVFPNPCENHKFCGIEFFFFYALKSLWANFWHLSWPFDMILYASEKLTSFMKLSCLYFYAHKAYQSTLSAFRVSQYVFACHYENYKSCWVMFFSFLCFKKPRG